MLCSALRCPCLCSIGGFGVAVCVLSALFVWLYHRRTAVRSSSPAFLLCMLGGLVLLFLSAIFWSEEEPTDASCTSAIWLLVLGASVGLVMK